MNQSEQNTPTEPQPSEPNKVKPLAQYLAEYVDYELTLFMKDSDRLHEVIMQALDAYQSTENVTIKIERK